MQINIQKRKKIIEYYNSKQRKNMGCAILPEQKNSHLHSHAQRDHKKTKKIDCRKRSSQVLDVVLQNVKILEDHLDQQNSQFAVANLKKHTLFCTMEDSEILKVVTSMQLATADNDSYIFKEGDKGACFFLIKQGTVDVQINQKNVGTLGKGQTFGQIALIYFTKRVASIKCTSSNSRFIIIKSKQFKQAMRMIRQKNFERTKALISKVHIFSLLNTKQIYRLVSSLVRQHHKKGKVLFFKNQLAVSFFIIQTGKVSIVFDDPNKKDIILGQLQSFGQNTFKQNSKREGTATVIQDLVCLTINQEMMKNCLGVTFNSIYYHHVKKWALNSCPIFQGFDSKQIDHIAMQFVTKNAKMNEVLMQAEKPVNSFIICLDGNINSKPGGVLLNSQYYYQKGNLKQNLVKNDQGNYAKLGFQKLKQIIQGFNTKGSLVVTKTRQSYVMKQNQDVLGLANLDYITKLGEGQFGLVHLVKDRKSGNLFALKALQKSKIKEQGMEQSAISQRQILASLCHPLIVGYHKAYQDKTNIYFLLEYIQGIQMFQAIRQIGILNKIIAQFYFGSIVLAIEYLHSRNIIYRDIKPQNSIVNFQGKVYLIDMGTAKILKSQNGYRTDTIIGTPHYMAPEVMQGKGYSFQADLWSLGVLFYELIIGHLPFAEKQENPFKVYNIIMKTQLTFPHWVNDQSAKNIIKRLINKKIDSRSIGGLVGIKNSTYFEGFQWDDLYQGKMVAPFIPQKRGLNKNLPKYSQMQGYPLSQFLYQKKRGNKKLTQQFQPWTNNSVI